MGAALAAVLEASAEVRAVHLADFPVAEVHSAAEVQEEVFSLLRIINV